MESKEKLPAVLQRADDLDARLRRMDLRLRLAAFWRRLEAAEKEAFFVRCDASNNPAAATSLGRVNIQIGFAPLRPAEFIILGIQVQAGGMAAPPAKARP